ncbi:DUF1653 domain-containing protein [Clostridium sp. A1-XYC3]|uniref:DUF1653 domain-containing protein n=1 Tax=Clostridium tanneri TaxID=3037988 RepID=A0ABU4JUD1_9CLOT|nr:DUF1653 domain-containing protein [Clostridium sp. A1-XYC3]MDW8801753.1 DUF1653 domain-containing protein [Clostridium sp. A1-XYC3]
MKRNVQIDQYYRHFKNHWYRVIDVAEHTETGEKLVIYTPLYGNRGTFARPLKMFLEEVPAEKENPTAQRYRFMSLEELNLKSEDVHHN